MSRTELHGTKRDGIEFRFTGEDDQLDEVVVYVGGVVVLHLEQISDQAYWMGLYAGPLHAHVNVFAKNPRAHVKATGEVMGGDDHRGRIGKRRPVSKKRGRK